MTIKYLYVELLVFVVRFVSPSWVGMRLEVRWGRCDVTGQRERGEIKDAFSADCRRGVLY